MQTRHNRGRTVGRTLSRSDVELACRCLMKLARLILGVPQVADVTEDFIILPGLVADNDAC